MVFIRPGAAGTHGAPRAALHWAAGAKKIVRSSVSELVSLTFFLRPEATGTRGAPGAVLRREAGAGAHGTRTGLELP
jgi:hypothetical protein